MFAVIQTGGKQYKVAEGSLLKAEKLPGLPGEKVTFKSVIAFSKDPSSISVGPSLNVEVVAEVVAQDRNAKVIIFKKKRRNNYRRKKTCRQPYTLLRVVGFNHKEQVA